MFIIQKVQELMLKSVEVCGADRTHTDSPDSAIETSCWAEAPNDRPLTEYRRDDAELPVSRRNAT
jgi:hypothetical protein